MSHRGGGPYDILQRRPQLLAAELVVLQRIPTRLPHIHHQERRRQCENLRRDRQLPFPPALVPLQPHAAVVLTLSHAKLPRPRRRLLQPRHHLARRGPRRGESQLLSLLPLLLLEQRRQIKPFRQ
ncbi:hypothetical protein RHGRI_009179 [Rhododendron griersonianum]|uniref:Uncharacterized protein n=1 Tax=Rhododendron griersonianum TaxID=479676 RepID=A0AAV6L5S0_9ERIC|nr:hypothetical protein RHGRI_009179 [Rhododendron griersonianum]